MFWQFQRRIDQLVKYWVFFMGMVQEKARWKPVMNSLKGRSKLGSGGDRGWGMQYEKT